MPVPVPAVVNLCQAAGIALVPAPVTGELVTPTGAAIVAALRTDSALPASYAIERVGYGAGKRAYENCSGVLRAVLIASAGSDDAATATATPSRNSRATSTTAPARRSAASSSCSWPPARVRHTPSRSS